MSLKFIRNYWSCNLLLLCFIYVTVLLPVVALEVQVNREEAIDLSIPRFNNGAFPGWNAGSPMIVRKGENVWFSLSRPIEGEQPYVNTFWQVFKRQPSGWMVVKGERQPTEREPCPLVLVDGDTLAIFVNPKTSFRAYREQNKANLWNSHPHLKAFGIDAEQSAGKILDPVFSQDGRFREHTYRGIATYPQTGEVFLVVQDPDSELYHPSYRDIKGAWHPFDAFIFPIRSLYPNLFVHNGAAHILAISDIKEPVKAWRDAKFEEFNRHWDYAFRDIYYTWTPDATGGQFETPLLIDSVADRPGFAMNLDLLVDDDGTAHILYVMRRFQYEFLRDQFFPDEPLSVKIGYARIKEGEVLDRKILVQAIQGEAGGSRLKDLKWGRLHRLEDGGLVVIYSCEMSDGAAMRLMELEEEGKPGDALTLTLKHPMGSHFFTNTQRGGSAPSNKIDLLELSYGQEYHSVRYAEIEVIR